MDLDGTLAKYDGWVSETHIGAPVPLMVRRVKQWLAEGREVRIFTARAATTFNEDGVKHDLRPVAKAIQGWCFTHLGQVLPITNQKDYAMVECWDDRAIQVVPNTGKRADGLP